MATLQFLTEDGIGDPIDSVTMLGGAPDVDTVTNAGRYGPAIQTATEEVQKFYKTDDEVLGFFELFDSPSVGRVGFDDGRAPSNVTDTDVTDEVSNHLSFPFERGGCMDLVVERL